MKKILLLIFCSFLVSKTDLATGAPLLDEEFFQSILQKYHLTEKDLKSSAAYKALPQHIKEKVTESSYCYRNLDGEVHGNHIHELRDIASTTKLFSSLFTLDTYGSQYQFNTFFYVIQSIKTADNGAKQNKRYLYIQGSGDPTFDSTHLRSVYSNRIKSYGYINEVYFDESFFAYIYAKNSSGVPSPHSNPGTDRLAQTTGALKAIFPKSKIVMATSSVEEIINQKNDETEVINPEIVSIQESSQPVSSILKQMNNNSNNYSASVLYDSIPNRTQILINAGFTEDEIENEIRIHNGSGYPTNPTGVSREDNRASCNAMLKLLSTLSNCIEGECKLSQVFPQACDEGSTLCSRFKNDPTVKSSVVAKTGVTNYVISLAGWLDDVKQVPFAFLITTFTQAQRVNAKLAIDELVSTIYKNTLQYPMLNESESISSSPQDLPLFLAVPKD